MFLTFFERFVQGTRNCIWFSASRFLFKFQEGLRISIRRTSFLLTFQWTRWSSHCPSIQRCHWDVEATQSLASGNQQRPCTIRSHLCCDIKLTNRFHLSVRACFDSARMTPERSNNKVRYSRLVFLSGSYQSTHPLTNGIYLLNTLLQTPLDQRGGHRPLYNSVTTVLCKHSSNSGQTPSLCNAGLTLFAEPLMDNDYHISVCLYRVPW